MGGGASSRGGAARYGAQEPSPSLSRRFSFMRNRSMRVEFEETIEKEEEEPPSPLPSSSELHNRGYICDFYDFDKVLLSKGSAVNVRKVTHISTNKARVVKQFSLKTSANAETLKDQAALFVVLRRHRNIIRLYETFEDHMCIYLLFEYCLGGNLLEHIVEAESHNERETTSITIQILGALTYMHDKLVCHRDLKATHILLQARGSLVSARVKVADLGSARLLNRADEPMSGAVGAAFYRAPEVDRGSYTLACDVWSCGVITYLLLLGFPKNCSAKPRRRSRSRSGSGIGFGAAAHNEDRFAFSAADWEACSGGAQCFLQQTLHVDPASRWSAQQALKDEWIMRQAPQPANERVQIVEDVGAPRTRTVGDLTNPGEVPGT